MSNSDGDYQRRKLATVGLGDAFAATVFSGDLGVAKPDPAIFLAGVAALQTDPATAVYVGDRWDIDVLGARGAGLPAVWLDRRGVGDTTVGAAGAVGAATVEVPDVGIARIGTLAELPGRSTGWAFRRPAADLRIGQLRSAPGSILCRRLAWSGPWGMV